MRKAVFDLGAKWANDPLRPRISAESQAAWSRLIAEWVDEKDTPLLVRKAGHYRGSRILGAGGRTLIPTDNSPAQWAFAVAHSGQCPRVNEVQTLLANGTLPIAMALKREERTTATYKGVRGSCVGTSDAGWKLAHIKGVALEGRGDIGTFAPDKVEAHFKRFMSPSNMLVVPAELAGLAEVDAFLEGFCSVAAEMN